MLQFCGLNCIYRCYIVSWMINKLLLQHNLFSGANHIPLSSQMPLPFHFSIGALSQSDQTNTIISLLVFSIMFKIANEKLTQRKLIWKTEERGKFFLSRIQFKECYKQSKTSQAWNNIGPLFMQKFHPNNVWIRALKKLILYQSFLFCFFPLGLSTESRAPIFNLP